MSQDFSDKVIFITGAARGQGAAHAKHLASLGAAVVLFDAPQREVRGVKYPLGTSEQLHAVADEIEASGGRALAINGDVRSQEELDQAVVATLQKFGKIDGLITNAGVWGEIDTLWNAAESTWNEVIDINLTGSWRTIKAVAPSMIEREEGSIVIVSSVLGSGEGFALGGSYAVSKHGLTGLMMTAALELGEKNIRVNALLPGMINTDIHRWQDAMDLMGGRPGGNEESLDQAGRYYSALKGRTQLDPIHVARSAAFLLSDDASQLTGVIMPVDAGHTILPRVNQNPIP